MSWTKLLAGLVSLVNRIFQTNRDNELRKDGARKAQLERRETLDEVRRQAAEVRRKPRPRSKPDTLERM